MDIQKRELWDRLENEPARAFRAFESFLSLPSGERTLLGAYRRHVDNAHALKPSDTWSGWSNAFAWRERAAAYDDHLTSVRREAYERAIEEDAGRQAREVEKARGRMNEILTLAYHRVMEALEDEDWVNNNLRPSDVIAVAKIHLDVLKTLGVEPEPNHDDDWTEEDDAELERIAKRVKARRNLEETAQDPDEQDSESDDSNEEHSEDSQGDET